MKTKLIIPLFIILSAAILSVSIVLAEPNVGISLTPTSTAGSACIGSTVAYTFRLTNSTTVAFAYNITYTSIWPVTGPTITPTIPAGGYYDIPVSIYIPWTTDPGASNNLSLYVYGNGYEANATATTTANIIKDWIDKSDAPHGARWSSVVFNDGFLYKIGGDNAGAQAWLDIYDITNNTWSAGTSMPEPRYWIDCESISGFIYCGGGFTGQKKDTLYIYDIEHNTWSVGPSLPYAIYSYASAAVDGKYYIIGGLLSNTEYSNAMLVYDPLTGSWDTTRASMSTARHMHAAGVIDGKIVVAGGYNGIFLSSAEVYDPVLNIWSAIAPMPSPWVNAADGVNFGRYLVVAGGSSTSRTSSSNDAFIYDAKIGTWHQLPDMDRAIYGAEGDSDGTYFWLSSGQIFVDPNWVASLSTTLMDVCAATCPAPVTGADFSWYPTDTPWTGSTIEFTATTSLGTTGIQFSWNFDDGSTGTGSTINHVFTLPQVYTVQLTAANCDGASISTKAHDVVVIDPPTIDAEPIGLESTQLPETISQQQLELCNVGDASLNWNPSEVDILPVQSDDTFQITGINAELPWLSESSVSGTITANSCVAITITFDASGLTESIYQGALSITSNDPDHAILNIPVSLTVTHPALELIKTVSVFENVCGTSSNIDVYANTTVYYCYTATNTGGTLFDSHFLTDDQLGDLLDAFPYTLTPGASISMVSDGVLITESITNQATWSAEYGDFSASDTDLATVTVIPDADVWVYLPAVLKAILP